MIPQYSWRCDGMRVRAPTDGGKRKSPRPRRGKTPVCRPANGLALANGRQQPQTLLAVPQRRSRRRLAGSPKPPMESRQAHSIHGVALSKASSRPRCATRGIPAPRCRARPAHNAAQSHQQRRRAQATPPMAPARGRSGCPKTEIRPKLQLFCDCELPRGVKTRIDARKSGKSDAQRPISASRRTERSPQSQKSCTEVGILFLRNGSSQRSNSCERHVCLQCQSGRAAARNHSASTIQALMPSPLAKIPR